MNREIKFRAWDKTQGKMLKVSVEMLRSYEFILSYPNGELMQYTGLKGNKILSSGDVIINSEIFEGDIVIRNNKIESVKPEWSTKKYLVVWNKEKAQFCLKGEETWGMIWRLQVVGNQFENPELLEGGIHEV